MGGMRTLPLFLGLLLLISLLPITHADWGELVQVRVLDAKMRPLPGANVNITWQITKGHIGVTANKLTNANGRVNFSIDNYEHLASVMDPYFTVYVKYGSISTFTRFLNNRGEIPRTFVLSVYKATFQTIDNSGQPISVNVDIDGIYKFKTNQSGMATIPLPTGRHMVNILFRNSKQNSSIVVSDDALFPLKLQLYQLDVQVLDDMGAPLDAQVYAGSDVLNTDKDGYVRFSNVTDSRLLLTVHYGQYKKELAVDLSSLNHTAVIFDLHKPAINNLQSVFNGSTLQVRANVADLGDYASGLAQGNSSVRLIYSFGTNPATQSIPMYAAGYDLFEAYLKLPEGTREVHYTVEASDAEGNLASSSDVFVAAVQKPVTPVEQPLPSTASKSWAEENLWVIIIFAMLIIGAAAYWYYLSRKPPSGGPTRTTYTYGKKPQTQPSSFSLPIKKQGEGSQGQTGETMTNQGAPAAPVATAPAAPAPPMPPSGSASGQAPPSPPSYPPSGGSASSKPSWAPPWAKMPGASSKPDNAPPWAGRFGGSKAASSPAASTPPSAPSAPAAPSVPAGPQMAPMPPPPSMPPLPPPSPTSGAPVDSSNPAFGGLPGSKPKPPPEQ